MSRFNTKKKREEKARNAQERSARAPELPSNAKARALVASMEKEINEFIRDERKNLVGDRMLVLFDPSSHTPARMILEAKGQRTSDLRLVVIERVDAQKMLHLYDPEIDLSKYPTAPDRVLLAVLAYETEDFAHFAKASAPN